MVFRSLRRAVGFNPRLTEIKAMIKDMGVLLFDFKFFLYLIACHASMRPGLLARTGSVKTAIIRKILENLNEPYEPDQIEELLAQAVIDPETDTIRYEDFVKLLLDF
jgi:Ca2+-binding EF-hand superfamily protein